VGKNSESFFIALLLFLSAAEDRRCLRPKLFSGQASCNYDKKVKEANGPRSHAPGISPFTKVRPDEAFERAG